MFVINVTKQEETPDQRKLPDFYRKYETKGLTSCICSNRSITSSCCHFLFLIHLNSCCCGWEVSGLHWTHLQQFFFFFSFMWALKRSSSSNRETVFVQTEKYNNNCLSVSVNDLLWKVHKSNLSSEWKETTSCIEFYLEMRSDELYWPQARSLISSENPQIHHEGRVTERSSVTVSKPRQSKSPQTLLQ